MLTMTDFFRACHIPLDASSFKVHLATGLINPPLDAFFRGQFKEWQEYQNKANFTRSMVVGLIALPAPAQWLFAGVYKVLGYTKANDGHFDYKTELLSGQEEWIGRLVIGHARQSRQSYLIGKDNDPEFIVSHVREKKMSVPDFPGYNAVNLQHSELRTIIDQRVDSWFGALSGVKGIYLISDKSSGKFYVGSATGGSGIWQRWSCYAYTKHGGNKDLVEILLKNSEAHCENFQYSILEIADTHATDEDILKRESFWKLALLTRQWGYNAN